MREILRGTLEHVSLGSVLQLAEGESFSGLIRLESASIALRDGDVVDVAHGGLAGRDALRELFLLRRGMFVLDRSAPPAGESLGNTMGLVMDGCRLADEWHRLAAMVLEVADPPTETVSAPVARVLDRLDGRRCVLEAVELAGVRPTQVVDDLLALLEGAHLAEVGERKLQLVEQRLSAPAETPEGPEVVEAPTPPADPDFFLVIEEGRSALKAKDYPTAEAAFHAALRLRPGDRVATQNLRRVRQLMAAET